LNAGPALTRASVGFDEKPLNVCSIVQTFKGLELSLTLQDWFKRAIRWILWERNGETMSGTIVLDPTGTFEGLNKPSNVLK